MKKNMVGVILTILVILTSFTLTLNVWSQGYGRDLHDEGYGAGGMMGQDPDEILNYGRNMMRYGFLEKGMSGGSCNYPGYNRDLSDETIKSLNAEQMAFIKDTESSRQTIYEKELYLKAELAKMKPDIRVALSFQKDILEAQGKFEIKMIEHLIWMKKINI